EKSSVRSATPVKWPRTGNPGSQQILEAQRHFFLESWPVIHYPRIQPEAKGCGPTEQESPLEARAMSRTTAYWLPGLCFIVAGTVGAAEPADDAKVKALEKEVRELTEKVKAAEQTLADARRALA